MATQLFTLDPSKESLYVYAWFPVNEAIREVLTPTSLDKVMKEIPNTADKLQVITTLFDKIMARVVEKFKNDQKINADCEEKKITLEHLTNYYTTRVLKAVEKAFEDWQAKHPEIQFKESVLYKPWNSSFLNSCTVL
jgi:hypothetical protein